MGNTAIEIQDLSKKFIAVSGSSTEALQNVSFSVNKGEFLTIIGPSGCGKSTALSIIAGLITPSSGSVKIDGVEVQSPTPDKVAMMFQEYTLLPWRSIIKNVEFGLELRHVPKIERNNLAVKYLKMVGLSGFENRYPHELSGGMKQRVALARSLSLQTPYILMDEPFGALDEQTRIILGQELVKIWEETKKTVIFVTHSLFEAAFLSDRVIIMTSRPGKIKKIIDVDVNRPRDPHHSNLEKIRSSIWDQLKEETLKARM